MQTKRPVSIFYLAALLFVCAALIIGCRADDRQAAGGSARPEAAAQTHAPITKNGMFFDTVVSITVYDDADVPALDACLSMAQQYEDLLSNTVPESDISKINAADGAYVEVSADTIALLKLCEQYEEASGGRFDITIGRLSDLWNFKENSGTLPDDADIRAAVDTIDYHAVSIRENAVSLTNPAAKIDLGGIAKGYIADRMKDLLQAEGVSSGIINLGGNVVVIGTKPDGSAYHIGIQRPFAAQNEILAYLTSDEISVVTSGIYERYFYGDDQTLYHHILDTKTGYPVRNGLQSVTIISDSSADGDGLSTTCFSLGLTDGMALIENTPATEAVFVTDENEVICTSGIKDRITLVEETP